MSGPAGLEAGSRGGVSVLFMVVTQQQCQGVLRLLVTPDFLWGCLGQGPVQPTLLEQRPLPATCHSPSGSKSCSPQQQQEPFSSMPGPGVAQL